MRPRRIVFLAHAEVESDPARPVPDWPLSPVGRARHARFSTDPALAHVSAVYSSAGRKARDGAGIHAVALGRPHRIVTALGENDRSATGYLPPAAFERMADAFFNAPDTAVQGWEPARAAQTRIMQGVRTVAEVDATEGDILIVSHGAVGALLRCALGGWPISRAAGQPAGGGHWVAFTLPEGSLDLEWRRIP